MAPAQSSLSVSGAGYSDPAVLRIAPGPVTTVFVAGTRTAFLPAGSSNQIQRAAKVPLPTTLAGFSVTITQQPNGLAEQLPIFAVEQDNRCGGGSQNPGCVETAITVQIPFDLIVDYGQPSAFAHTTAISVSDSAGSSQSFPALVLPQNIHVLTTCDAANPGRIEAVFLTACQPVVTHADGSLVSALSPGGAGEELILYAFGLGVTNPQVNAGEASPLPAAVTQAAFGVSFGYRGTGANPAQERPQTPPNPVFVGLTPGQVGLYQVNFVLPQPMGLVADCNMYPDGANLSVVLTSNSPSMGAADICAAVQ
jgi:uncharacterized protein (TIGR03437 family)